MTLIKHQLKANENGIVFTVLCGRRLTEGQTRRAIRLHWMRMTQKNRSRARRLGKLDIHLLDEAADLL